MPLMALGRDPQVLMMKVNGRISERSMQSRSASEKINSACRLEHFGEWVSRVGRGGTIARATWGAVSSDFTTLSLPSLWTRKQKALKKMFSTLASVDVQFSSIAQSCLTLCDRMKRSMPGLPIHHQLLESTQTHVIESVMPSNHLILCRPLLLLPSIFPSIRVFSNESALRIRWPKYWSFSFNIVPPMNTQD